MFDPPVAAPLSDVKVELVESEIMNQLSYHVSRAKFDKEGFVLKNKIDTDINILGVEYKLINGKKSGPLSQKVNINGTVVTYKKGNAAYK